SAGVAGEARGFGVGEEEVLVTADAVTGARNADDGDGARAFSRRESQPRSKPRRVTRDDFSRARRRATGGQFVRGELRARPAVRFRRAPPQTGRDRHITDRRPNAGHACEASYE